MPNRSNDRDAETVHVKKYGNRRFYSSSESRFMTIDELAQSVRRGAKVRVTDADSGADITSEILTQILLEGGRAQHFPVELLEQMIRLNEHALKSFWGGYFEQSRKVFENLQENWQSLSQTNLFFQWLGGAKDAAPKAGPLASTKAKSSKPQGSAAKSVK